MQTGDYTFGLAKYGTFELIMIRQNGYINATKLCKDYKKNFSVWKNFYEEMMESEGSMINIKDYIYIHPGLLPHLLSWISPKFGTAVADIMNTEMVTETVSENKRNKRNNTYVMKNLNILEYIRTAHMN